MVRMDPAEPAPEDPCTPTGNRKAWPGVKTFRGSPGEESRTITDLGAAGLLWRAGQIRAAEECYWEGIAVNPAYGWAYRGSPPYGKIRRIDFAGDAVAATPRRGSMRTWASPYEDIGDLQAAADPFRTARLSPRAGLGELDDPGSLGRPRKRLGHESG